MIKYLVKRTVKNEMLENSKKIAFYTGIAAVSTVGGYISYKAIKKMRSRKEDEIEYLEYEEYDSDDLENELEKDELKEKVAANFNTAKADAVLGKADVAKEDVAANNNITKETNVLVLCAGGGTSGLLANALNKAAAEYNVPVKAAAGGYGAHREMLPEFDLVILAPQVASNFDDMKAETDKLGIKLAKTEGAQYIKLTRDGQGALAFVQQQFD